MALKFLKTPPPHVVLLPDTQFFVRAVPVPDATTHDDVAAQVELALETLAPFPVSQMYYGYHWLPGARHALAYAAYRKRFNQASVETWPAADAVLPAFATLLTPAARPGATALLHTPGAITAVHWGNDHGVPDHVVSRALPQPAEDEPPLSDADRDAACAALRNELLRAMPGTVHLAEYQYPDPDAAPPPARADGALVFSPPPAPGAQTAPQTVTFTTPQLDALDVRDKAELAARRAARRRDSLLWRAFLGCLCLLGLCALVDAAVVGGKFWQAKRAEQVRLQAPYVAEIDRQNLMANRIEDLSNKRLLPFEMIDLLRPRLPNSILFTRVITRSLSSVEVQARTNNAGDFNAFRTALASQSNIEKIDITNSSIRDGATTFTMVITFKPGAVVAAEDIPPPAPPPSETPKPAAPDAAAQPQTPPPPAADSAAPSIHDQIRQQIGPGENGADAPPPPAALPPGEYTVASGDTGARIASRAGVTVRELIAANPDINWNRLQVGQKLNIPQHAATTEPAEEEPNQ